MGLELYLCAVNHLDFRGPERLKQVLNELTPHAVAVEAYPSLFSNYAKAYKTNSKISDARLRAFVRCRMLEDNTPGVNFESLLQQTKIDGYEFWVTHAWAKKKGKRVYALEDESLCDAARAAMTRGTQSWAELLGQEPSVVQAKTDADYDLISDDWTDPSFVPEQFERDKVVASRLLALKGRILVIRGAAHVFGTQPKLTDLLPINSYTRFKLNEIEKQDFAKKYDKTTSATF